MLKVESDWKVPVFNWNVKPLEPLGLATSLPFAWHLSAGVMPAVRLRVLDAHLSVEGVGSFLSEQA